MRLYAFGSNGSGQLGIGTTEDSSTPQICHFPDGSEIPGVPVKIVAGGNHTLLLLDDGTVYCAGLTQDGRGTSKSMLEPQVTFQRASISLGQNKTKLCSTFWDGSVFVNDKNEIFTTGFGSKGGKGTGGILSLSEDSQKLHDWLPPYVQEQEVVILAGGVDHSVLVLSNGQVFGWGNGRKGQLGHPAEIVRSPRQFQKLKFPVTRAVCGREFTYLVGSDGRHTILGSNKHGIQSPDFTKTLTIPKTIAASWGSLFVLDSSGQIKSWGRNDHGQLAPPNLPPIAQIAAGSEHVVALTEGSLMQSGKVISWGWGEHGNCGAEIDENGDIKKGTWNEIHTHHSVLGVGAGCATSFFWTDG